MWETKKKLKMTQTLVKVEKWISKEFQQYMTPNCTPNCKYI